MSNSISQAILFYSNFMEKSKKMKDVILALNVDISTICVDPKKVKRYLKGNKWGITQVPSLLLISSGSSTSDFKVLINSELDQWFSELIDNVKALESPVASTQTGSTEVTPLDIPPETEFSNSVGIATNPGYVSSAIVQNRVRDSPSKNPSTGITEMDAPDTTTLKQIKKETISPTELAKQMAAQREQFDETVQEQRPFGV